MFPNKLPDMSTICNLNSGTRRAFLGAWVGSFFGLGWFTRDAIRGPQVSTANGVITVVTILTGCIQWSVVIYL